MIFTKNSSITHLFLSFGVSVVVALVSLFSFYEAIELKLLDARFRLRGPLPTRPDIATVDIDVRALQEEGRFQDWTRDKHEKIIKFGQEHGVKMLAFDIYFPEKSTRHILASDLGLLKDSEINSRNVHALIRDYDREMAEEMIRAGNIYLAESFKPMDEGVQNVRPRSPHQDRALELLEPYYQAFSDSLSGSLFSFYDIEPPISDFIRASKGIAFAQAKADDDGVIRRYPLVGEYDGRLFPSMALLMACDYFGTPFKNVKVIPGEYVILPHALDNVRGGQTIRIPISKEGFMMVNWAGDWKEDFEHYPYSLLRDFYEAEHSNYILSKIKSLMHEEPELLSDVRSFQQRLKSLGLEPVELVQDAFSKALLAERIETSLLEDSQREPKVFFESLGIPYERVPQGMVEVFWEIKDNLAMERALATQPDPTYDSVRSQLNRDESYRLKRNFTIIKNLLESEGTIEKQHPLYFYPSQSEFTLHGKTIAPFGFQNKILFYGLTATGTHDLNPTPFNARYPMVGLHANALNTILSQIFIQRVSKGYEVIVMLAVGIILGLLVPRFHPVQGAGATLALWSIYAFVNFMVFTRQGVWLDIIGPTLILLFGYVSITIFNYITQEKDKRFLHDTFKAYLSPELIDEMYEEKQTPQLGGEEGIRTAFFTDIQNFSTIAEQLGSPSKLVELLNEYLTAMTDILLDHRGTLDKYEGDAIIAFFGAPIPLEDHAERACLTALAMQKKLLELREKWRSEEEEWPEIVKDMFMRIGLNSGPIVTGNMGSKTRMNYTMMGDAVNVAARLESICKQYGVFTVCSGETISMIRENSIESRLIDYIRVVGKSEPVKMYEILGIRGELESKTLELHSIFHEGFDFYLNREWKKAITLFKKSLPLETYEKHPRINVTPSKVFITRCEEYLKSPPGKKWNGIYIAISK